MDVGDSKIESMGCFLHVITMLPPTQLKGSEYIFHGRCSVVRVITLGSATKHRGCYKIGYLFGPELGDAIQTSKNLSR